MAPWSNSLAGKLHHLSSHCHQICLKAFHIISNACQIYSVAKMWTILTIKIRATYWTVGYLLNYFSSHGCENMWTSSYHHQIRLGCETMVFTVWFITFIPTFKETQKTQPRVGMLPVLSLLHSTLFPKYIFGRWWFILIRVVRYQNRIFHVSNITEQMCVRVCVYVCICINGHWFLCEQKKDICHDVWWST